MNISRLHHGNSTVAAPCASTHAKTHNSTVYIATDLNSTINAAYLERDDGDIASRRLFIASPATGLPLATFAAVAQRTLLAAGLWMPTSVAGDQDVCLVLIVTGVAEGDLLMTASAAGLLVAAPSAGDGLL